MNSDLYGEFASILTALCWSFGSLLFTFSSRRLGSGTVNRVRLWIALVLLVGLHLVMFGTLFPFDADPKRFFWLGLSGLIGYIIGDGMLFESFVLIGPRLAMLMMTLVPIFSTALAWLFLDETLSVLEASAIAITLAGIAWVVSEKKNREQKTRNGFGIGLLLGMGGALGQAIGLLLAKKGLEGNFSAISGNLIRVLAGSAGIAIISLFKRDIMAHMKKLKDTIALKQVILASTLGPVVGVVLSLYAVSHTEIGIASTLMSLSPLFLLPLSKIFFKEQITQRAIVGTVIALIGSILLFFI